DTQPDAGRLGRVVVFTHAGETWTQDGEIPGSSLSFGTQVALSSDADTALIGAGELGRTAVFKRSGEIWSQQGADLVGSGATEGSGQASSSALSRDGNTALIGGPEDGSRQGAVWAFANRPTLTVSLAGTGSGSASGAGITCPGKCSANYEPGTVVTLTETPTLGSIFSGW